MFAVIKTGGKQYRVAKDDHITVERINGEAGDIVALDNVLMIGEAGKAPTVGAPAVDKAAVFAEVVEQGRGEKIVVFKKQRRQNHRRKNGHRQDLTTLRIVEVSPTGTKPKTAAKPAAKKADEAKDAAPAPEKKTEAKKPAAKKPVKNADLWQELDMANSRHQVRWHWVKGHAGDAGNERADQLARDAIPG